MYQLTLSPAPIIDIDNLLRQLQPFYIKRIGKNDSQKKRFGSSKESEFLFQKNRT